MSDLSKVTIGIKTFLRDEHLVRAVDGILHRMPEVKMIIADDGEVTCWKLEWYESLRAKGHAILMLPFDSGFGKKSNVIASALNTPYLLVGSDDFDFGDEQVSHGIYKLACVLDRHSEISVASGRVGNRRYEFDLRDEGDVVSEIPVESPSTFDSPQFTKCDLTVNYSLIRKEVFETIRWDDDVKIGSGEHGAFFVDLKRAGKQVVCVAGVNINEQPIRFSERYRQYRNRARSPERPCFDKRGIKKYVLGDGTIDYQKVSV